MCNYILVFISIKMKAFCGTQNETPKMVKNVRLYQQIVKKSRNTFAGGVQCRGENHNHARAQAMNER